jgi:hypothetical protein
LISVQLAGGLGNQLFQYYLGQYLHLMKEVPVSYILPTIEKSHPQSSIIFFFPDEKYVGNQSQTGVVSRGFLKISKSSQFAKKILLPIVKEYSSDRTGMDHLVSKVSTKSRISGYFQTGFYFDYCINNGVNKPKLLNTSIWYVENSKIFKEEKPASIHLRFGDYLKHRQTIGNLNEQFYLQALENLMERKSYKSIYCFTDDLKKSFKMLQNSKFIKNIKFIDPPNNSSPSESLLLQSEAAGHIISNSTFSWWAANLSTQECVIAPKKWFFGMDDPEELFPSNWILQESRWEK